MPSHFKGPEEQVRALSAFINLVRATDSLIEKTSHHVEESGLTQGQFAVLEALHHLGPMCQHTLAKKLLRSGGNTTVVIDNLERKKWVKRIRSKSDRRQIEIHLTPKGKRLIERVFPEHARVVEKLMAGLTSEEQNELRRIAAKLGCTAARLCPGQLTKGDSK
jgi:MarR family transcriptional regulator, 2-MHQ and catechol-resistance regulon repressor